MCHQYRNPSQQSKNRNQVNTFRLFTEPGVRYKYLNTTADASTTFKYARQQNEAHTASDIIGTPRLSVLARIAGADPPSAKE